MSWRRFCAALYSSRMADLARVRVAWQNWPGAPGVSTFYLNNPPTQAQIDAIRSFFNTLVAMLPSGMTIQVPNVGDVIDDATGHISGAWSVATQPATVTATGTGAYAGSAGMVVHWLTSSILNGRRPRGRTFLVPVVSTQFSTDGSPSSAALTTLAGAATGLLTSVGANMKVWHRPTNFAGGSSYTVTSSSVPDLSISLRSRRV